jgi:hypothetical protein
MRIAQGLTVSNEWVLVDLGTITSVCGIITQGAGKQKRDLY